MISCELEDVYVVIRPSSMMCDLCPCQCLTMSIKIQQVHIQSCRFEPYLKFISWSEVKSV